HLPGRRGRQAAARRVRRAAGEGLSRGPRARHRRRARQPPFRRDADSGEGIMAEYAKPLPEITAESKPVWDACARHQLLVQTCRACGGMQYYPRGVCAACWSPDVAWTPSGGRGRVYTFTVTHRTQARGFRDELPYVLAWITLDEGVQVMSNQDRR